MRRSSADHGELPRPGWTSTWLINWERVAQSLSIDIAGAKTHLGQDELLKRVLEPEEPGAIAALPAAPESAGSIGQVSVPAL